MLEKVIRPRCTTLFGRVSGSKAREAYEWRAVRSPGR
jgi:hypothetical protein